MVTLSDSPIAANEISSNSEDLTQCGQQKTRQNNHFGGSQMSKLGVEWGGRGVEWGGRGNSWKGNSWKGNSWKGNSWE
jgi:hypothetical protein